MKNNICSNTSIERSGAPVYECSDAPTKLRQSVKFVGQDVIEIMKGMNSEQLKDLFKRVRFKYTEEGDELHVHSTTALNDETGLKIEIPDELFSQDFWKLLLDK